LAVQIGNNIQDFAKYLPKIKVVTVYGGANIEEQIKKLKRGAQIVVGTPGRTVDLIKRKALKLGNVQWLVLDEADEMLNMGFKDELDKVLEATPETKQTLLFSATFPKEVEAIAENYMVNPAEVSSGEKNSGTDNVKHVYYQISERTRYPALKRIADINPDIYAIIFCRTRRETQEIATKLISDGYNADSLHGDLSQAQRDTVMEKFRQKNIQMLVATDVAARGLDVDNLTHVINHKLPDQIENYTHRSGRTGRAGNTGVSIVLINRKEKSKIASIERKIKQTFELKPIPTGDEVCHKQILHLIDRVKTTDVNKSEIEGFLPQIYEKLSGLDREELIQRFVSLEFNTFLSYYENAQDLNDLSTFSEKSGKGSSENMTRFFINLGRKDQLNPARLIGLINDQQITEALDIGAIDILDTFSFFEVDKNFEQETQAAFEANQPKFSGRSVNIEITKKEKSTSRRKGRRPFKDRGNKKGKRYDDQRRNHNPAAGFGRKRKRKR
jgi:ATP-dependent RNA helicase DeaD